MSRDSCVSCDTVWYVSSSSYGGESLFLSLSLATHTHTQITSTPANEEALLEAARENDETTVVALLKAGTNPNCCDKVCVCVCKCVCVLSLIHI